MLFRADFDLAKMVGYGVICCSILLNHIVCSADERGFCSPPGRQQGKKSSSSFDYQSEVALQMAINGKSWVRSLLFSIVISVAPFTASASDTVKSAGDAAVFAVAAFAGGMTLWQKDTEGMIQLAESAALDLAVTYGLKYSVRERRPDGTDDQSFPSAHSSVSFASAEYLRKRYGWEYGLPAYGVAAFVAYSRVESKAHYLHDVLAGAAIGMASSYLFTTPNRDFNLATDINSGYFGVKLSRVW